MCQFKTTTHRAALLIAVSEMVICKASAFMVKLTKDNDTAAVILRSPTLTAKSWLLQLQLVPMRNCPLG
jgi:hypothetical protein